MAKDIKSLNEAETHEYVGGALLQGVQASEKIVAVANMIVGADPHLLVIAMAFAYSYCVSQTLDEELTADERLKAAHDGVDLAWETLEEALKKMKK